jgi:hypothetical protein
MQEGSISRSRATSTEIAERCMRGHGISLIRAPWLTTVLATSADARVVDIAIVALNGARKAAGQRYSSQNCGGCTRCEHTDCDLLWSRQ